MNGQDFVLAPGMPIAYGQLRCRLGSVSQRMLTRMLRNLESSGLIARRVTTSKSIAVEYSLTKPGRTFIAPVDKNLPLGEIKDLR